MLSTKHEKLALVAPALARAVALEVASVEVDTDQLGTFTGDVARAHPPLETAVRKARLGMAASGSPLGVASEGTVGPDVTVPFLTADRELVVLVDDELGIVIHEEYTAYDGVMASTTAAAGDDLDAFLARADFPRHRLIARPNLDTVGPIVKGIADLPTLRRAVADASAASRDGLARVETDLRAHVDPSRRRVIEAAAERLAARVAALCPSCATPGWGPVDLVTGVPCAACGTTVEVVRAEIDGCTRCDLRIERPIVRSARTADPSTCPHCTP